MFILREICNEKNIASQELADKTGIPKRTIDEYRTRRKEPSLSNGLKIADAIGIDAHDLFAQQDNEVGK